MKKLYILIILMVSGVSVFAQNSDKPEMDDAMRQSGMIYVVVATISIVFVGLAIYLFAMDRRLKKLEKEISSKK